jgi:hypothetical protein
MLDARLGGSLTGEWWQDVEGLALAVGVTGRRTSAAPDRCRAALAGCCVPRTEYAAVLSIVLVVPVATPVPAPPHRSSRQRFISYSGTSYGTSIRVDL